MALWPWVPSVLSLLSVLRQGLGPVLIMLLYIYIYEIFNYISRELYLAVFLWYNKSWSLQPLMEYLPANSNNETIDCPQETETKYYYYYYYSDYYWMNYGYISLDSSGVQAIRKGGKMGKELGSWKHLMLWGQEFHREYNSKVNQNTNHLIQKCMELMGRWRVNSSS